MTPAQRKREQQTQAKKREAWVREWNARISAERETLVNAILAAQPKINEYKLAAEALKGNMRLAAILDACKLIGSLEG